MLDTVPDRVDVNARCAPITSLFSRDTSAPVWVRVKNASDIRWTCANTGRAEVEDQALADAGGQPAHRECQARVEHGDRGNGQGEEDDEPGVLLQDPVVDDVLDEQRRDHDEGRVDDGEPEEEADRAAVRPGEPEHAADGVAVELLLADAPVGAHVPPHRPHAGSHGHLRTSLSENLSCPTRAGAAGSLPHQRGELAEPPYLCLALGEPLLLEVET